MKTTKSIISIIIGVLIFCQSYILSGFIVDFVKTQNIFSVSLEFSLLVVLMMLVLSYTLALSIGACGKWEQYLLIPIPFTGAVFLTTFRISAAYSMLVALGCLILTLYDVYRSDSLRKNLLRFDPKMIMRFSTRGVLLVFSILGGVLLFLTSANLPEVNVGKKVVDYIEKPLKKAATGNVTPALKPLALEGIKEVTEHEINSLTKPYKNWIQPIMALLTFALFQFCGALAYVLHILTIDSVFWIVKRLRIFKIEKITVEQEILKF